MQLAIDTSTEIASLALVQDETVLAELTWRCEQNHTTQLLPHLEHLLNQAKLTLDQAECVFVAKGPGSYNGLRVGVSTAKGIAFGLGIPLIAIGTMEVEASPHGDCGLPVCPLYNAGRSGIGAALFQKVAGQWTQLAAEHLTTIEALCLETTTETVFCGDYATVLEPQLKKRLGAKAVVPPASTRLRRAAFLAELGLRRFKAGDVDDAVTLQPIYLRGPAITPAKHK